MHLAVEAVGTKRGGGWVILNEVLEALSTDPRFSRISVFGSLQSIYAEARFLHPKIEWKKRRVADHFYAARIHWLSRGFNDVLAAKNVDCVLQMNGVGFTDYPTISYIQQPLFFSKEARATLAYSHQARIFALEKIAQLSCEHSSRVFVQTHWMQAAMHQKWDLLPQLLHSPPPKIERMFSADRERSVVWIGSELSYKRLHFFRALADHLDEDIRLTDLCSSNAALSREEILSLLKRSTILAITSLTESLGLPLIEAMAKGTMIVAPDFAYAKEICGDAALYYQGHCLPSFLNAVQSALEDPQLRREHIRAGTRRALELDTLSQNYLALRNALVEVGQ